MNEEILEIELEIEDNEIDLEFEEVSGGTGGVRSYNDLFDKPTLNGKVIQGDMLEEDPTVPDWAKEETKPTYTAQEVGAPSKELSFEEIKEVWDSIFK